MAANNKPKVVVVGAGMAGLSAAAKLCKSGQFEVTILEAMDRPGGRIHTVSGFASNVIELGANWIHGTKGNPVFQLAERHNLIYKDSDSSSSSSSSSDDDEAWFLNGADNSEYWMENGKRLKRKRAQDAIRFYYSIIKKLQGMDPHKMEDFHSFAEYTKTRYEQELNEHGITDPKASLQYWLVYDHCVRQECVDIGSDSPNDISVSHYLDYESLKGDYYTMLGETGYFGLLEKILADIPTSSIHYNSPVAEIQYMGDESTYDDAPGVVVRCEDGRVFSCSHVIVTSSTGFLKANHETFFKPPLPDDKQEALKILQCCTINKIFLRFEKPFWKKKDKYEIHFLWNVAPQDEDEEEGKKTFFRQLTDFHVEDKNEDVLLGWIFGKGAEYMETLTDEEVGKQCVALLRTFLNKPSIPEPTKVLCTRWHSNPYVLGSYAAFLPQGGTGNEYAVMTTPVYGSKKVEEAKVPVLLFAGEALHKKFQSTTHGAMASGQNQAEALISFYSSQK